MTQASKIQQEILDQLQGLADEIGHIPTRAEFDASPLAKTLPIWRITSLLHSFDKAASRLSDPAIAALDAPSALKMVTNWALQAKELPTPTAWTRWIRSGTALAPWTAVVAASGLSVHQLQDAAHTVLCDAGYVPRGKGGGKYARPASSGEISRARKTAAKTEGHGPRSADDAAVNALLREERNARAAADIRQGRIQTAEDRAGSEAWSEVA